MLFLMILNVESCSKNLNQKIKNVHKAVKEPENQIWVDQGKNFKFRFGSRFWNSIYFHEDKQNT